MKCTQNKKFKCLETFPNFTIWDGIVEVSNDLMTGFNLLIFSQGNMDKEKKLRVVDNFTFLPQNLTVAMITDNDSWRNLCNQLGIKMYTTDTYVIKSIITDDLEYFILQDGIIKYNDKVISESWNSFE